MDEKSALGRSVGRKNIKGLVFLNSSVGGWSSDEGGWKYSKDSLRGVEIIFNFRGGGLKNYAALFEKRPPPFWRVKKDKPLMGFLIFLMF